MNTSVSVMITQLRILLAKSDIYHIDTSNVLFILSGAFVGLDTIIKRRVAKGSIGFTAKLTSENPDSNSNGFLPFFTPNRSTPTNAFDLVDTSGKFFLRMFFLLLLPIRSLFLRSCQIWVGLLMITAPLSPYSFYVQLHPGVHLPPSLYNYVVAFDCV